MYLAVAIVLFAIIFAASSAQQHKKDRQYEEYKSRQRKKTSREYYYAQFYFLELLQKLLPVFQEFKQYPPLDNQKTLVPNPKALEIAKRWKAEVLTVNHWTYDLESIAVCKARERVIAEGYLPSDPYQKEYFPSYDPWKYPERHVYTVRAEWPKPACTVVSTYIVNGAGYQEQIRNLNEVAEKFGYHDFCDTILHLHFDEASGLLYSEPAAEPCPYEPLKEKLFGDVPEWAMGIYSTHAVFDFGLKSFQVD